MFGQVVIDTFKTFKIFRLLEFNPNSLVLIDLFVLMSVTSRGHIFCAQKSSKEHILHHWRQCGGFLTASGIRELLHCYHYGQLN